MIKYCLEKWNQNYKNLEEIYRNGTGWNGCNYIDIVYVVTKFILGEDWDANHITQIDNGDYQGTLLFLIPKKTYQPSESEYLMTFVNYGSCSGCDTLLDIQSWGDYDDVYLDEKQIKGFMWLSKDIVTNMIKPYNTGWRQSDEFEGVKFDKTQKNNELEIITEMPF